MKKILSILMIFILFTVMITPQKADAFGVVGSNALKGAVINAMESAGVKFANKEAKERAFDAWNMRAYEKWKADEAAGKNSDLWAQFNAVTQDLENINIVEMPDKPGFGEILLDATWFGMAISIGSEIGYAIEDAHRDKVAMMFLAEDIVDNLEGADFSFNYGFRKEFEFTPDGVNSKNATRLLYPNGVIVSSSRSFYPSERLPVYVTNLKRFLRSGVAYCSFTVTSYVRNKDGTLDEYVRKIEERESDMGGLTLVRHESGGYIYDYVPKSHNVPIINPNPHVIPLITPDSDIESIPDLIPNPVPIVLPVGDDPFIDNPYVTPYDPVIPNPDPDPDKPVNPEVPPYEKPDYKPNPDKIPEVETPEYPEEVTNPDEVTNTGFFSKLWEWLKLLLDALFKILNAILMLPLKILELLWDALVDLAVVLFVPSDGFWDDNINNLKKMFWQDEIDEMIDEFSNINGSGGVFKDIRVTLMGVDGLEVIDADSINSVLDTIHKWVRGVIFPLLILFNINSLYKLIRGTSLVEATRRFGGKDG